jgi:mono/diheme cytochrome c family protein
MKKSLRYLSISVSFALVLFLSACLSLAEDVTPPPGYRPPIEQQATPTTSGPVYPAVPPDPAKGEPIYIDKCAPCHGEIGLGDGVDASDLPNPVTPLGSPDVSRLAAPVDWHDMITEGNLERFMPPFTSLSDRQRWDVVAYLYTLSTSPEELAQGEELYNELCSACHGRTGKGNGPDAVGLPVDPADFTDQAFMAQRSSSDLYQAIISGSLHMPDFERLGEDERWALTAYIRSLSFAISQAAAVGDAAVEVEPYPYPYPPPAVTPIQVTPVATASPEGIGVVNVQVVSGNDGPLPEGLEVVLHGYDNLTEVYSGTMRLAGDGLAVFEEVPMLTDRVFFATVDYGLVSYRSNFDVVSEGLVFLDLDLTFYETTTSASSLRVDRLHVFFDFIDDETVQVVELLILANPGGKTIVPTEEGGAAITFALPEGASNLEWQENPQFRFVETPEGLGIESLLPDTDPYELMFAYQMPYERNKLDLNLPVSLRTMAVIVMAPAEGVKIKSDQLQDAGQRDVQGVSFSMLSGGDLEALDTIAISLSGRPKSGTGWVSAGDESSSAASLAIGLSAFGLVLIMVGLFVWGRVRGTGDGQQDQWGDEGYPDAGDADDLMDAIIALDDLYQAGELPEDAYHRRRATLKEQLKSALEQQDD